MFAYQFLNAVKQVAQNPNSDIRSDLDYGSRDNRFSRWAAESHST